MRLVLAKGPLSCVVGHAAPGNATAFRQTPRSPLVSLSGSPRTLQQGSLVGSALCPSFSLKIFFSFMNLFPIYVSKLFPIYVSKLFPSYVSKIMSIMTSHAQVSGLYAPKTIV